MYIQIGRERILILDIRGAKCFCEGDWTEGTPQTTGIGFISWVKFRFTELISLGFSLFVTFSYSSPERHTSKSMWVKTHFQGIMWSLFTSSGGKKKSVCQVTLKTPFITSGCLCKWISCVQLLPHRSLMLSWIRTTLLGHLENVVHPERTPRCQELQWANGPHCWDSGSRLQSPLSKTSGHLRLGRLGFASSLLRDEPVANWRRGLLAPGLLTSLPVTVFCSVNPISWQRLMGLPLRDICILIKSSLRPESWESHVFNSETEC